MERIRDEQSTPTPHQDGHEVSPSQGLNPAPVTHENNDEQLNNPTSEVNAASMRYELT